MELDVLSLSLTVGGALIGAVAGAFGAGWRVRNELRGLERDLLEQLDERTRKERELSDRLYARADAHATLVAEQRETRTRIDQLLHAFDRLERKLDRHLDRSRDSTERE